MVTLDYYVGKFFKAVDPHTVIPSSETLHHADWNIKMRKRYQRLNSIFMQFIKNILIKSQSCFIGHSVISIREDTCPTDAHPKAFKAHFSHQCNIFLIVMIEIRCTVTGIVCVRSNRRRCCNSPRNTALQNAVRNAPSDGASCKA